MKIWEYNPFRFEWELLCEAASIDAAARIADALRRAYPLGEFVYRDQQPPWQPFDPDPVR